MLRKWSIGITSVSYLVVELHFDFLLELSEMVKEKELTNDTIQVLGR